MKPWNYEREYEYVITYIDDEGEEVFEEVTATDDIEALEKLGLDYWADEDRIVSITPWYSIWG